MLTGSQYKSWLGVLLGVALLLAPGAKPLEAQGVGRVVGRAVQEASGDGLEGAQVRLLGTSISTLTNAAGRFLLPRVPAGTYTLEVTYIGREAGTAEVLVEEGGAASVKLSLPVAVVALGGLEVLGVRAMTQARALSMQKNAPNIINVVASDQMGRFPDASAPEALQRIPGIAVGRDQGEGRYVHIRGGSSDYTQVNLNGASVPSPEGEGRRVALDAVPVDILEAVEVSKAITPDMDASALGGAVNMVTRKAPEQPTFSAELGGGYAPIRSEPAGKGSLTYGRRLADGRFGFLVSGSYSSRQFGSDDIEPEYDLGDAGLEDDALAEFQSRYYTLTRDRIGGTASFDYRLAEDSRLFLTGTYTEHEDTEQRQVLMHGIGDGELAWEHKNRREKLQIATATLGGEHVLGNGLGIDYGLSLSGSAEDTPYDNEVVFVQEGVEFAPDMTDPDRIQPNPSAGMVGGTYVFDGLDDGTSVTTNVDRTARLDLTLPYRLGGTAAGDLKVGLKVMDRRKDQNLTEFAWELDDGDDIVLGQDVGVGFDASGYNPGDYAFPPFSTTGGDVVSFVDRYGSRLESEFDLESETEDYDLSERVTGVYAMTQVNLTPDLMVLPGVRYEHTRFGADGFDFDPDTEELTPTTGEKDYGSFFPMAHVRYRLTEETNVRAAFTTAIARPNFFDLVPHRLRDDEDLELGNPDLEPTISRNLDLLFEHYDSRIGLISAGVFHKRLDDPIFSFRNENELGGETIQPDNGRSAEILGAELAVQQQLAFLPAPFDGFGVYANYTYTSSEGTLPEGRKAQLLGQADHAFNAALSYERSGFSGQLSLNFSDAYIDEYGEVDFEDVFVGRRHQLDFSASHQLTPTSTIYVELLNLTNQPLRLYQGHTDRPRQIEFYQPWGTIGFRYTVN